MYELQRLGWLKSLHLKGVWAYMPPGESEIIDPYIDLAAGAPVRTTPSLLWRVRRQHGTLDTSTGCSMGSRSMDAGAIGTAARAAATRFSGQARLESLGRSPGFNRVQRSYIGDVST